MGSKTTDLLGIGTWAKYVAGLTLFVLIVGALGLRYFYMVGFINPAVVDQESPNASGIVGEVVEALQVAQEFGAAHALALTPTATATPTVTPTPLVTREIIGLTPTLTVPPTVGPEATIVSVTSRTPSPTTPTAAPTNTPSPSPTNTPTLLPSAPTSAPTTISASTRWPRVQKTLPRGWQGLCFLSILFLAIVVGGVAYLALKARRKEA